MLSRLFCLTHLLVFLPLLALVVFEHGQNLLLPLLYHHQHTTTSYSTSYTGLHDSVKFFTTKYFWVVVDKPFSRYADALAPSVKPSVPRPFASPAVPARNTPRDIPDRSKSFSVMPTFIGPDKFLARAAGSTESSAAAAEPNNNEVPGAVSPVSRYMFSNISGR